MAQVDWNFLNQGYHKPGTKTVSEELISEHAEAFGKLFARERGSQVSSNQLRGFYGDAKALETKIRSAEEAGNPRAFENNFYLVKMLKAKAAYIQGKRTGGRVSKDFERYIRTCVDKINGRADFEAFMRFFESTVGFYYGYGGERVR